MGNALTTEHEVPQTAYKKNKENKRNKTCEGNTKLDTKKKNFLNVKTIRNQSYVESVETCKNDCSKVEDLLRPNLHDNTYPTNIYPNNPNQYNTYPNNPYLNSTYPNNTYPNNTYSNNIYPKLHNTYSDDNKPSCPSKEEVYDVNLFSGLTQNVSSKKKDNIKNMIIPPPNLKDLTHFIESWTTWEEQLIIFLNLNDENKEKYHLWGNFLLHFMGAFSQEILGKLVFNTSEDKNNFIVLINKFNAYHKFYITTKSENESIVNYIERLKVAALKNMKNVDDVLKQKLAKDIEKHCKERFIALASSKLPDFNFDKTFVLLTLAEIAFLWNSCNQCNWKKDNNCNYCGKLHLKGHCLAKGKECNKCKRRNHFAKCCPGLMYINNCAFCGGDHGLKKCTAFGEICTKCGKQNHFSWMCTKTILIKNCHFCGQNHMNDRNKCPAKNSTCCICKTIGHYEVKCRSNQTNNNVK